VMDAHDIARSMAAVRLVSATIEATAAYVMWRGTLERAVAVNAVLGVIGPSIFAVVSALGILGLSGRIPPLRLILVAVGAALVLASTRVSAG
jgi:hypothetical protein